MGFMKLWGYWTVGVGESLSPVLQDPLNLSLKGYENVWVLHGLHCQKAALPSRLGGVK